MTWYSLFSNEFRNQLKKLRKTRYYEDVQKIVLELENAADPAKLGVRKQGLLKDYYSYEIGRRLRILYKLDYEHKIIEFVSLGDHKQVYGKD